MSESPSAFVASFFEWVNEEGNLIRGRPNILPLSICSVPLVMHFRDTELAKGTGFFWRMPDGIALVTAWHNLSGLHHTRRICLHSQGAVPDRITGRYMSRNPQTFQSLSVPLYLDEEMQEPRWMVHRRCGSFFDMAALGLTIQGAEVACVNDYCQPPTEQILPGSDVFAVGYPLGISSIGDLPIWKRGSIASDIDLPTDAHPKFLVDMPGRSGLSGAPVYRAQRGVVTQSQANGSVGVGFGNHDDFLGIYTGRAASQDGSDTASSDLGYVWRASVVTEFLANPVMDEKPEIGKGVLTTNRFWGTQE